MRRGRAAVLKRFWSKVDMKKPDECWNWIAYKDRDGYGTFSFNGTSIRAHRFIFNFINNTSSESLICHTCDNPSCVNLTYLFSGTQKDNMSDMIKKKRDVKIRGSEHHFSKLKESQIIEIRDKYKAGLYNQRELSKKYDVDGSVISKIVNFKIWKSLKGEVK